MPRNIFKQSVNERVILLTDHKVLILKVVIPLSVHHLSIHYSEQSLFNAVLGAHSRDFSTPSSTENKGGYVRICKPHVLLSALSGPWTCTRTYSVCKPQKQNVLLPFAYARPHPEDPLPSLSQPQ